MDYQSYITDLHLNLHPGQIDELGKWLDHCERVSDFFTLAYYPYRMAELPGGFCTEREMDPELMREQWERILASLAEREKSDGFLCFPGFEWQGTGEDGDHNVYFKTSGQIALPARYAELADTYRDQDAIAIPHHLAYSLGNRGKNWDTHDESFSPVAEIFSHHGSSERDATSLSMGRHIHMGPRVDETSVVTGLKRGAHFGLICSGDNHEVPAMVKYGRAGVWASEYSKDAIWNALVSRRTFGFTGSRIDLWCEAEGHPLGSVFSTSSDEVELKVRARANSKVERIELYLNGDLDDAHVVRWREPRPGANGTVRFKFRVEFGWGPNVRYFPEATERVWKGTLSTSGRVVSVEPVFSSFDNRHELVDEKTVSFTAKSQKVGGTHWVRDSSMRTEGYVFELEAPLDGTVTMDVCGEHFEWPVEKILAGSFLEIFEDEAKELIRETAGIEEYYRSDAWYHNAYKVKVYQGFASDLYEIEDGFAVHPGAEETSWFVKLVQADGQTAWASPIWITHS
ncbi:MAG: DUF3604 domain-containing protein [Atopobiaceae bacterium]|nr:DUF3604 domain-containing protein [Atopobiaceae bacterium]